MGCDIHPYGETKKDGVWVADGADQFEWVVDDPEDPENSKYPDLPSVARDRNYTRFNVLGNDSRGPRWAPVFPEKGVPADVSEEVKAMIDNMGEDGHTHSWVTLKELYEKRAELLLLSDDEAGSKSEIIADMIIEWFPSSDVPEEDRRVVFFMDN